MYDNVQLWFAKNENGNIVTIDEVDKNTKDKYYCAMCGSELIPRQGEINSWCFAHIDKSKCNSESMIHFWVKNKLIEKGDRFIVKSDIEKQYVCKDILVEESWEVDGKIYRPDLTIITECEQTIYFEMNHTNKKKLEDYIDVWISLNNIVVEVDTKILINSQSKKLPIFNALWYEGRCFNVKNNNTYYNTIGIYKEKLISKGEYENHKNEIKHLDWLFRDIIKYKNNEIDIEYMSNLIDNIENEEVLMLILHKKKCNSIYKDYLEYKINIINNMENYEIVKCSKGLILNDIKENTSTLYNTNSKSMSLNEIVNRIKYIQEEHKHQNDLNFARKNDYIKHVISKIDSYLKARSDNYHFYDRFGYDLYVTLAYNCKTKIDFDLRYRQDVIYSNDEKYIEEFFKVEIDKYISNLIQFNNKKYIENSLENINKYYNKIEVEKVESVNKVTGKRKYRTLNVKTRYSYGLKFREVAENCFCLDLCKIQNNYDTSLIKKNSYLYVISDGIYRNDNENRISFYEPMEVEENKNKLRLIKALNSNEDWEKLEKYIKDELSNDIRNDRYDN